MPRPVHLKSCNSLNLPRPVHLSVNQSGLIPIISLVNFFHFKNKPRGELKSRALAFEKIVMPRRSVVRVVAVAATQTVAPNRRRMPNLEENVRKMFAKDQLTYQDDNGVVFVHRCKKRARLTVEEKEEVCCIINHCCF